MKVKDYGIIKLELDADTAPITVTNFITLVNNKFYDGLTFHRIIEGFMIQGGDPSANGTGGSPETIKGEFIAMVFQMTYYIKEGLFQWQEEVIVMIVPQVNSLLCTRIMKLLITIMQLLVM